MRFLSLVLKHGVLRCGTVATVQSVLRYIYRSQRIVTLYLPRPLEPQRLQLLTLLRDRLYLPGGVSTVELCPCISPAYLIIDRTIRHSLNEFRFAKDSPGSPVFTCLNG